MVRKSVTEPEDKYVANIINKGVSEKVIELTRNQCYQLVALSRLDETSTSMTFLYTSGAQGNFAVSVDIYVQKED